MLFGRKKTPKEDDAAKDARLKNERAERVLKEMEAIQGVIDTAKLEGRRFIVVRDQHAFWDEFLDAVAEVSNNNPVERLDFPFRISDGYSTPAALITLKDEPFVAKKIRAA